jgi:hypothetical protein
LDKDPTIERLAQEHDAHTLGYACLRRAFEEHPLTPLLVLSRLVDDVPCRTDDLMILEREIAPHAREEFQARVSAFSHAAQSLVLLLEGDEPEDPREAN